MSLSEDQVLVFRKSCPYYKDSIFFLKKENQVLEQETPLSIKRWIRVVWRTQIKKSKLSWYASPIPIKRSKSYIRKVLSQLEGFESNTKFLVQFFW